MVCIETVRNTVGEGDSLRELTLKDEGSGSK